jgi:hypothetical protein
MSTAAASQPSPARRCPNCGIGVGDEAAVCWQCRASLRQAADGGFNRRKSGEDIDRRGWFLVAVLSVVVFIAFFLPYATYTDVEYDWYGDETATTIPITGFELADGAVHRSLMGMTIRLDMGGDYPVLWLVPSMAFLSFVIALVKKIPKRPTLLGVVGIVAVFGAVAGYVQLVAGDPPDLFSDGTFAPDYGLAATVVAGSMMALIGFKGRIGRLRRAPAR